MTSESHRGLPNKGGFLEQCFGGRSLQTCRSGRREVSLAARRKITGSSKQPRVPREESHAEPRGVELDCGCCRGWSESLRTRVEGKRMEAWRGGGKTQSSSMQNHRIAEFRYTVECQESSGCWDRKRPLRPIPHLRVDQSPYFRSLHLLTLERFGAAFLRVGLFLKKAQLGFRLFEGYVDLMHRGSVPVKVVFALDFYLLLATSTV